MVFILIFPSHNRIKKTTRKLIRMHILDLLIGLMQQDLMRYPLRMLTDTMIYHYLSILKRARYFNQAISSHSHVVLIYCKYLFNHDELYHWLQR